jgi:hypothetical protein
MNIANNGSDVITSGGGEWTNSDGDVMCCVDGTDPFGRRCLNAVTRRAPHTVGITVTKTAPVATVEEFIDYATARGFQPPGSGDK